MFGALSTAYLKTGRIDLAEQALASARARGMSEARYLARMAALLWDAGDMARLPHYAEPLCARPPNRITPRHLSRLARAYLATGAWEKAEKTADRLMRLSPSPAAVDMKYEAILNRLGASEWEAAFESRLAHCADLNEVVPALMMMVKITDRQSDCARRLVEKALATWPNDASLCALGKSLGLAPCGTDGKGAADAPHAARPQAQLDQAQEALRHQKAVPNSPPQSLIPAFAAQLAPGDLTRPLVEVSADKDILVSPRAPGSELAIVFTGLLERSALPLEAFDAYLSAAGMTAVYLRDFNRLLFCHGIQSLGPDFETGVEGLRRVIDGIGGIERVTTIGSSAGGTGAINFGLALPADRILCFSTPTTIVQPFLDDIKDHRGQLVLARLNKLVPPDLLDPRPRIKAQARPVRIDLIYGQEHSLDCGHAQRLRGHPGVNHYGLDGFGGHASLNEVILRGALLDTLAGDTAPLEQTSMNHKAAE